MSPDSIRFLQSIVVAACLLGAVAFGLKIALFAVRHL